MTKSMTQKIKQRATTAYQNHLKTSFEHSRIGMMQEIAKGKASLADAEQRVAQLQNQLSILQPIRDNLKTLVLKGEAQLEVIERSVVTLSKPVEVK